MTGNTLKLGRKIAIVIIPAQDEHGREFQAVWLKQLKTEAFTWDSFMKEGGTFLDNNVEEEFLLAKAATVDIAEDYANKLSTRLQLRVFRIEDDNIRGTHRILEYRSESK